MILFSSTQTPVEEWFAWYVFKKKVIFYRIHRFFGFEYINEIFLESQCSVPGKDMANFAFSSNVSRTFVNTMSAIRIKTMSVKPKRAG